MIYNLWLRHDIQFKPWTTVTALLQLLIFIMPLVHHNSNWEAIQILILTTPICVGMQSDHIIEVCGLEAYVYV